MRPAKREERDVLTVNIDQIFTNYGRNWVRQVAFVSRVIEAEQVTISLS
jgi:hypothetical protein